MHHASVALFLPTRFSQLVKKAFTAENIQNLPILLCDYMPATLYSLKLLAEFIS